MAARIAYMIAHSDPNDSPGAVTVDGICERHLSRSTWPAFRDYCLSKGHEVELYQGPLAPCVRLMNKYVRDRSMRATITLHFNNPPAVRCSCGADKHAGTVCRQCGAAPDRVWTWGHSAVLRRCAPSLALARSVLSGLDALMPFSRRRSLIQIPDRRYGPSLWPNNLIWRHVLPPAVLIEAGFAVDQRFSNWITDDKNVFNLGLSLARGVCRFLEECEDEKAAKG